MHGITDERTNRQTDDIMTPSSEHIAHCYCTCYLYSVPAIPTPAIPTLCHGWCCVSVQCAHISDTTHPNPSFGGMVPLRMSSIVSAVALLGMSPV